MALLVDLVIASGVVWPLNVVANSAAEVWSKNIELVDSANFGSLNILETEVIKSIVGV